MGSIIGIYCPDCKKTFDFQIGIGYLPLNSFFLEDLQEDTEILNQLKTENIAQPTTADELTKCEHKLYYCQKCQQVGEYNYFKLKDVPTFTPKRMCPDCSKRMRYISNTSEILTGKLKVCCPECKKEINPEILGTNIMLGFWD